MYHSHLTFWLYCLSVTGLASSLAISPAHEPVQKRTVIQGWSVQASTCPSGGTSCGSGSCCPSSLFCQAAANDEVASCCTTNSACRGAVENNPLCADSSWSLWKGFQGNGFCCEVGQTGVYNSQNNIAGTCVASAAPAGYTTAVLMSTGTGTAPTTTPANPTTTTTSSGPTSTGSSAPGTTGKPVFFHYLIGTITDDHCEQDIKDAMALGADAFALNINTDTASWAIDTVASLFKWAGALGFKLFFSFDMTGFSDPDQFTSFLQSYVTNEAHFLYNGLPLVSTFNGGASGFTFGQDSVNDGWKVELQEVMANAGHPIYFAPAFQDVAVSSDFFNTFPTLNGAMNWNSWPFNTQGDIVVPTADDQTLLSAAHSAGKTFIMGLSPLQFKHYSGANYYRRGEQNLEYRFGQVLSLQPDFVEIQTWNDAGESHYMGNSWPEPIEGTPIVAYTQDYDHTGYWQLLPAFIKAYKSGATSTSTMYPTNGAAAQGTFWHHTLLAAGTCPQDSLGPPDGVSTVEDRVTAGILVAAGQSNLQAVVTSGGTTLGTQNLSPGFNGFSFLGMTTGTVSVTVKDSSSGATVISGSGPIQVASTSSLCNYNFQVVGLA